MIEVPAWFTILSLVALLVWLVSIIAIVYALIKYETNPDHYRFKKDESNCEENSAGVVASKRKRGDA